MHDLPQKTINRATLSEHLVGILRSGPATIDRLRLILVEGAGEIGRALERLEEEGIVTHSEAGAYALKTKHADGLRRQVLREREFYRRQKAFPRPHELDGDWRFTFHSAMDLIHLVNFRLSHCTSVCCLGTPSIAVLLDILGFQGKIVLVDYNEKILESVASTSPRIGCIRQDLIEAKSLASLGKHEVIFTDPPWAGDYCRQFAIAALSLLKGGGIGCLVYFPSYNRKTAPRRQLDLIGALTKLQARMIAILPERVDILERESICPNNTSGRKAHTGLKGTVCIFEKIKGPLHRADPGWDLPMKSCWQPFHIANSRWMLRVDGPFTTGPVPSLRRLSAQGIMSRYHALATRVGLWTSGGQLFRVGGSKIVAVLLRGLAKGLSFEDLKGDLNEVSPRAADVRRVRRVWIQLWAAARKEAMLP